ncbi:unnamed protein product [Soboliphyme baturini]|uniref:G protein-coupled receptor n=1 Tax=Soboliphyme baturini TaxID=241478 RepID=A0A183J7W7_9BILA|nr:unnamed protein product [Soboliphyme baturini]
MMEVLPFNWYELLLHNMSNGTYNAINNSQLRILYLTVVLNVVSIVLNGSCALSLAMLRRSWSSRFVLLTTLLVCYTTQSGGMLFNVVSRLRRWANEEVIFLTQRECFLETAVLNIGSYLVQDTSLLLALDAVFAICFPVFYYCRYKWWILACEFGCMYMHVAVEIALRYINAADSPVIVCTEYSDTNLGFVLKQARRDLCIIAGNILLYLLLLWLVRREHNGLSEDKRPALVDKSKKRTAKLLTLFFCELSYCFAVVSGTMIDISLDNEIDPLKIVRTASFGFLTQIGAIMNGVIIITRLRIIRDFCSSFLTLRKRKFFSNDSAVIAVKRPYDLVSLHTTCFEKTNNNDLILSIKNLPSN